MSKKLTLKVTKTAFYKGALVNPGEIIKNYSGNIPTWATLANGDEMPKEDNKNVPPVDDSKVKKDGEGELVTVDETNNKSAVQDEKEIVVAGDGGVHEISADDAAKEGENWRDAFLSLPLFEARTWRQRLAFAPALPPGTPELARAVAQAAQTAPAVWMEGHGLCCHGENPAFCLDLSEHLEHLAGIQLESMGAC